MTKIDLHNPTKHQQSHTSRHQSLNLASRSLFLTVNTHTTTFKMAKNSIVPVIILLLVVFLFAVIGFVVYTIVQDISDKTKAKMEKKNIKFSKDGLKVSMKEVRDEDYKDQTQRFVFLLAMLEGREG